MAITAYTLTVDLVNLMGDDFGGTQVSVELVNRQLNVGGTPTETIMPDPPDAQVTNAQGIAQFTLLPSSIVGAYRVTIGDFERIILMPAANARLSGLGDAVDPDAFTQLLDVRMDRLVSDLTDAEKAAIHTKLGVGPGGGSDIADLTLVEVLAPATDQIPFFDVSDSTEKRIALRTAVAQAVNDDMILDLVKSVRAQADRGKFLGISTTDHNALALLDAPEAGAAITVAEDGTALATDAETLNFGAGLTATNDGTDAAQKNIVLAIPDTSIRPSMLRADTANRQAAFRTAIGAGTSSFSGAFADLTGRPNIFNNRGAYADFTAYAVGDVVTHGGQLFYVATPVPASNTTAPSDGATWVLLSADTFTLTDDGVLDLAKMPRVTGDRGSLLGVSATDEDALTLIDVPTERIPAQALPALAQGTRGRFLGQAAAGETWELRTVAGTTVTSLALDTSTNVLTLTDSAGDTETVDLSGLVGDTTVTSLSLSQANVLTLTDSAGATVTVSLAALAGGSATLGPVTPVAVTGTLTPSSSGTADGPLLDDLETLVLIDIQYTRGVANQRMGHVVPKALLAAATQAAPYRLHLQGSGTDRVDIYINGTGSTARIRSASTATTSTVGISTFQPWTFYNLRSGKGDPGVGVPAGGTAGQILAKSSATDHDTAWIPAPTSSATLTDDAVLDLIATTRSAGDRGSLIGVSLTDEDALAFLSVDPGEDNVQADWGETDDTSDAFIRGKPDIPDVDGLNVRVFTAYILSGKRDEFDALEAGDQLWSSSDQTRANGTPYTILYISRSSGSVGTIIFDESFSAPPNFGYLIGADDEWVWSRTTAAQATAAAVNQTTEWHLSDPVNFAGLSYVEALQAAIPELPDFSSAASGALLSVRLNGGLEWRNVATAPETRYLKIKYPAAAAAWASQIASDRIVILPSHLSLRRADGVWHDAENRLLGIYFGTGFTGWDDLDGLQTSGATLVLTASGSAGSVTVGENGSRYGTQFAITAASSDGDFYVTDGLFPVARLLSRDLPHFVSAAPASSGGGATVLQVLPTDLSSYSDGDQVIVEEGADKGLWVVRTETDDSFVGAVVPAVGDPAGAHQLALTQNPNDAAQAIEWENDGAAVHIWLRRSLTTSPPNHLYVEIAERDGTALSTSDREASRVNVPRDSAFDTASALAYRGRAGSSARAQWTALDGANTGEISIFTNIGYSTALVGTLAKTFSKVADEYEGDIAAVLREADKALETADANAVQVAGLTRRTHDLRAGQPVTGWANLSAATEGGIAVRAAVWDLAAARALSAWEHEELATPSGGRMLIRLPHGTNPHQARVDIRGRHQDFDQPVAGMTLLGSSAETTPLWDFYAEPQELGTLVTSIRLQLTGSAAANGSSSFFGNLDSVKVREAAGLPELTQATRGRVLGQSASAETWELRAEASGGGDATGTLVRALTINVAGLAAASLSAIFRAYREGGNLRIGNDGAAEGTVTAWRIYDIATAGDTWSFVLPGDFAITEDVGLRTPSSSTRRFDLDIANRQSSAADVDSGGEWHISGPEPLDAVLADKFISDVVRWETLGSYRHTGSNNRPTATTSITIPSSGMVRIAAWRGSVTRHQVLHVPASLLRAAAGASPAVFGFSYSGIVATNGRVLRNAQTLRYHTDNNNALIITAQGTDIDVNDDWRVDWLNDGSYAAGTLGEDTPVTPPPPLADDQVHFGTIIKSQGSADIVFSDDDIATLDRDVFLMNTQLFHVSGIPDGEEHRLYWAIVDDPETERHFYLGPGESRPIGHTIRRVVRTIGSVEYVVYIMTAANAVGPSFNGEAVYAGGD